MGNVDIEVTNIEIGDTFIHFTDYGVVDETYEELQNMYYNYPEVLEGNVLWF